MVSHGTIIKVEYGVIYYTDLAVDSSKDPEELLASSDDEFDRMMLMMDNGSKDFQFYADTVLDFTKGSGLSQFVSGYSYVRNNKVDECSAMDFDGSTVMIPGRTLTIWNKGKLQETIAIADPEEEYEGETEAVQECLSAGGEEIDRLREAYRRGYQEAMVASELLRFGRIWNDECREVNGNNMAPIISLFLSTVDQASRSVVQNAILKKYRKQ